MLQVCMEARRKRAERSVFFPFEASCMPDVAKTVVSEVGSSTARGPAAEEHDDEGARTNIDLRCVVRT